MRRLHRMPFGAEVDAGGTRFRLWAPAAANVELELDTGPRSRRPLASLEDGWFELRVDGVGAGARYAYRIDGRAPVPDPASRSNPDDVHAASAVVDPGAYEWDDAGWQGRRWEEAVVYELHVGAFTDRGSYTAALERLDDLQRLGVTAVELMPLAAFPGRRNWGYDGVLPFAPDASYGTPEDLKRFIDAAHRRRIMVLLDVVYNHFGPEGNYLHSYAPQFFSARHATPWGDAINFDGPGSRSVRDFYVHNALYWLEEFHLDGLRLDAIHSIRDDSPVHIVAEIAAASRQMAGARHVHLILENDRNEAHLLARDPQGNPTAADAQWNDDMHHALHVLTTGEVDGYYADYAERPLQLLGRCLAEGFAYQGEPSAYRGGEPRGEVSRNLPPAAFVAFTQTHDQVGNRAHGERLWMLADEAALRQSVAAILLAPAVPMLFMGEEFAASSPFLYFCDFEPGLADAVRRGRRQEFARFERFRDPDAQAQIPDPNDARTFERSRLDWSEADRPPHSEWRAFYRHLLNLRALNIVPRLDARCAAGSHLVEGRMLRVHWMLADSSRLHLLANFGPAINARLPRGAPVYEMRVHRAGEHARLDRHGLVVTIELAP